MAERVVPEAFPPGEFIRDSLGARGWKQADLALIMGVSNRVISELVSGKRRITTKTAKELADAFGNEAEEWMKLQALYDLALDSIPKDNLTARKSRLWREVPIRDAFNRGWLVETKNIDFLEAQVLQFYRTDSLDRISEFECAARRSTDHGSVSKEQLAWFRRAKNLAESLPVTTRYSRRTFGRLLNELEMLRVEPEEARKVPSVLLNHGIRFFIVEHLPGSKIDGVCFWLGNEPVVVLSMRYDRIDWFWFTLIHELGHVYHGHGKKHAYIDTSLVGADAQVFSEKQDEEKLADEFASDYLIGEGDLNKFIESVSPVYSDKYIKGFANHMVVHPGIVVGRLQHMAKIPYSRGRKMLVKIRENVVQSVLTDGWGHSIES